MNPKDIVGSKKAPLQFVPPALEIGASEAMENGANKYGPFNWREKPVEYMTYLTAIRRHILALIDGQDLAEDTGIHHLKHIVAGGGILLDAMAIPGGLIDNRPPKGPAADLLRALDRSTPPVSSPFLESVNAMVEARLVEELAPRLPNSDRARREASYYGDRQPPIAPDDSFVAPGESIGTFPTATVEQRGEWPLDTRVAGRLTCCGATEHTLACPHYRT